MIGGLEAVVEASLKKGEERLFGIAAIAQAFKEVGQIILTINWVSGQAVGAPDHSVYEAIKDSGCVGGVWRQI